MARNIKLAGIQILASHFVSVDCLSTLFIYQGATLYTMAEVGASSSECGSKRSYEQMSSTIFFEEVEIRLDRLIESSNKQDRPLQYMGLDCCPKIQWSGLDGLQTKVLRSLCMESVDDLRKREHIPSHIFRFARESLNRFGSMSLGGRSDWKGEYMVALDKFLEDVGYKAWVRSENYTTTSGYQSFTTLEFRRSGWEMLAVGDFVKYLLGVERCIFKTTGDKMPDHKLCSGNSVPNAEVQEHYDQIKVCMELQDWVFAKYFEDVTTTNMEDIANDVMSKFFRQNGGLDVPFRMHFSLDVALVKMVDDISEDRILPRLRRWLLVTAYDNIILATKQKRKQEDVMRSQLNVWLSYPHADNTMEKYFNCMNNACKVQEVVVKSATKVKGGERVKLYNTCLSKNSNPCLKCMREMCWARPVFAIESIVDKEELASLVALGIYRTHMESFCFDNLHHLSDGYQMSSSRITMDMLLSIKTEDSVLEHSSRSKHYPRHTFKVSIDYPAVFFNLSSTAMMVEFGDGRKRTFPLHLMEIESGCRQFNTLSNGIDTSKGLKKDWWDRLDLSEDTPAEMGVDDDGAMWTNQRVVKFIEEQRHKIRMKAQTFNDYSAAGGERTRMGTSFTLEGKPIWKKSGNLEGWYDFLNEDLVYEGPVKILGEACVMKGLVAYKSRKGKEKCDCMICKASNFVLKSMSNLSLALDKPCSSFDFDTYVSAVIAKPYDPSRKRHAVELLYLDMMKEKIFNRSFSLHRPEQEFEPWHIFRMNFILYHGINLLKNQKEMLLELDTQKFEEIGRNAFLLTAISNVIFHSNSHDDVMYNLKMKEASTLTPQELQNAVRTPRFWQIIECIFFRNANDVEQARFLEYFTE